MSAPKLNHTIDQGATWRHTLILKAGPSANAPALDLTGYSARMQIRADVDAQAVLLELSDANGRIVITPLEGRLELYISDADTAALAFDRAVYDLKIKLTGGDATRVLQGLVLVNKQVTR